MDLEYSYLLCKNNHTLDLCGENINDTYFIQDEYEHEQKLERILSIVVPILFSIVFILGLIGNALVVIVIASNKHMRNTTNLLIFNLAIADLLFVIFCIPFTAVDYVLPFWPFGNIWCKIVQYFIIVTVHASVITLVLMSIDRFLGVEYPLASIRIRTEENTLVAIIITWALILLLCLPAIFAHGLENEDGHEVCTFKKESNHVVYQLVFVSTSCAIPLFAISLLYFRMLFRLLQNVSTGASRLSSRSQKRVTRMVLIVVGVFAGCWIPIQLILVLRSLNLYQITDFTLGLQIAAQVLGYTNSCVNPILYAFLSKSFRKSFKKVIFCNSKSRFRVRTRSRNNYQEKNYRLNIKQVNETAFGKSVTTLCNESGTSI